MGLAWSHQCLAGKIHCADEDVIQEHPHPEWRLVSDGHCLVGEARQRPADRRAHQEACSLGFLPACVWH
eukprot:1160874-Pelagomonas_calceolata.AAC.9